ncbi:hypothetical protein [Halorussus lipolyticus]|uniref:hypothetical protein n=1 Tax=Halorussus lipolyticus TaxID=3034024 RepID=UPI0023E7F98D|nr:hypothetical protein [Halorussus sp. DT80]
MSKDNNKYGEHSRRKVVSYGLSSALGLSFVGNTLAKESVKSPSENHENIDLRFNPTDRGELKEFMLKFHEYEEDEQEAIFQELTPNRQEAVLESQKVTKIGRKRVTNSGVSTSSSGESSDEIVYPAKTWYGTNAWKFHHQVNWSWDDLNTVDSISHSAYATDVDFAWTYKGVQNGSKNKDTGEYNGTAQLQGHFVYGAANLAELINVYPYSKLGVQPGDSEAYVIDNNCDCPNIN